MSPDTPLAQRILQTIAQEQGAVGTHLRAQALQSPRPPAKPICGWPTIASILDLLTKSQTEKAADYLRWHLESALRNHQKIQKLLKPSA